MKSLLKVLAGYVLLPLLAGLGGWLLRGDAVSAEDLVRAYGVGVAEGQGIGDFHRDTLPGEGAIFKAAAYFDYPEPNDAQRLAPPCNGTCKDFVTGPVAIRVYSAADGNLAQFGTWVAVAGLTVAARNKFAEWGLDGGKNAQQVVAHNLELIAGDPANPRDPKWQARIVANGVPVKSLLVSFKEAAQVPTTASFFWDGGSNGPKRQIIGIRCPGGICFVGSERLTPRWEGVEARCTSANHCASWGYSDEQELASDDGMGNLRKSGSRGLIVPLPGASLNEVSPFLDNFVDVAAIKVSGASYEKARVTLPSGREVLLALRVGANGVWEGQLRDATGNPFGRLLTVRRHDHGNATVLAATRWRWSAQDEGIWVRCGPGCCEVDLE